METEKKSPHSSVIVFLFFAAFAYISFQFASGSTLISKVGDDKSYFIGSYHLSKFENFTPDQKWDYAYFHIHKPLIIALMMGVHGAGLSAFWWALPWIFYMLCGILLFLFLKDKIQSSAALFCAVSVLMLNSVFLYFGLHLLPGAPLDASLLGMLYFLDRAVKPDGAFSKNDWHATMACAIAASLFRIETLPVLLLPLLYYSYIMKKPVVSDANIRNYLLIAAAFIALFFLSYMFAIEKTANFPDYPGILLSQFSKVKAATDAIGANQGNLLYMPVEAALSFTLLPFILSLAGLCLIARKKAVAFYPAALLFVFLLAESSFITFISHGEQRYATRLFPMLAIFLAYFLDYFFRYARSKSAYGRYIAVALSLLLILSSYYMVHRAVLPDQPVTPYENKMLTVITPADDGFLSDRIASAVSGDYFITHAMQEYPPENYNRIFTNVDAPQFAEYFRILYGKEIYRIDNETEKMARADDAMFMLLGVSAGQYSGPRQKDIIVQGPPIMTNGEKISASFHVYILTPQQYFKSS